MLRRQGGKCAVCRKPPRGDKPLAVDHKHGTDPVLVRGVICRICNLTIGYVGESVAVLKAMIRYIERGERRHRRGRTRG